MCHNTSFQNIQVNTKSDECWEMNLTVVKIQRGCNILNRTNCDIMGNTDSFSSSPCKVGDCVANMSTCFIGDCSVINSNISLSYMRMDICTTLNRSTCSMVIPPARWKGEVTYDEEGCFSTNDLRNTPEYDQYLQVKFNQKAPPSHPKFYTNCISLFQTTYITYFENVPPFISI